MKIYENKLLEALGFNPIDIKIFLTVLKDKEITLRNIERHTGLCQPVVSLSVTRLVDKGLVYKKPVNNHRKGRPEMIICFYAYAIGVLVDKYNELLKNLDLGYMELLKLRDNNV